MTHKCIRTLLVFFYSDSCTHENSRTNSKARGGGGGGECHMVKVRYIIHLYWLVVQTGFYSDMVEC